MKLVVDKSERELAVPPESQSIIRVGKEIMKVTGSAIMGNMTFVGYHDVSKMCCRTREDNTQCVSGWKDKIRMVD